MQFIKTNFFTNNENNLLYYKLNQSYRWTNKNAWSIKRELVSFCLLFINYDIFCRKMLK